MSPFIIIRALLLLACINLCECSTKRRIKNSRSTPLSDTLATRVLSSKRTLRKEEKGQTRYSPTATRAESNGDGKASRRNAKVSNKEKENSKGGKEAASDNLVVPVTPPQEPVQAFESDPFVSAPGNPVGQQAQLSVPVEPQQQQQVTVAPQEQEQPEQYFDGQFYDGQYLEGPYVVDGQDGGPANNQQEAEDSLFWNFPHPDTLHVHVGFPTGVPTGQASAPPSSQPSENPTGAPTSKTPIVTAVSQQLQKQVVPADPQAEAQAQQAGNSLQGPGCQFAAASGRAARSFEEGQSMGDFSTVNSCANNVPAAFPGYCISSAPNQTVYPYCFFKDAFNQNICGRSGDEIGLLHPNRTLIHCKCVVSVSPYGLTYDIKVTSNCDMVDLTTVAPATLGDMVDQQASPPPTSVAPTSAAPTSAAPSTLSPVTTAPTTASPVTAAPVTATPATAAPVTAAPVTAPPTTSAPTTAPPTTAQPTTSSPVASNLGPATTYPTFNSQNAPLVPEDNLVVTYQPGNLTVFQEGIWLSHGLSARVLARAGQPVPYTNSIHGAASEEYFHPWPDGAAVFNDNRPGNSGGYIYVSNSEVKNGGVGALTFNANGDPIHFRQILYGTRYNCNGGRTPWGTWVTAEEDFDKFEGRLWQIDPYGVRQPEPLTMGAEGGAFEAFAYDIRDFGNPRFFASEDDDAGCLRRWTPTNPIFSSNPWAMLHGAGVQEYLMLQPTGGASGTFTWTTDMASARENARQYYRNSEGIEVQGSTLYFVVKGDRKLFTLDLDKMTYYETSTRAGLFDGEPDQIKSILQDDGTSLLYFSEDWGQVAGIHARDQYGQIATILEGPQYSPETTGIDFSPDGKRMYFAFQENGVLFEVTRDDGMSFHGKTVNLKPRHTDNPATHRRK